MLNRTIKASASDGDIDDAVRTEARRRKARELIVPTADEDAAIATAALSDPDAQPLTDAQLQELRPARRRGRPALEVTKTPTSIRFDNAVLDSFKVLGDGWQTRINDVLMQYLADTDQLVHRYHATVQSRGSEQRTLAEFIVLARDEKEAREKVKRHLRAMGRLEDALGQVRAVATGGTPLRELPLIT